MSQQPQLHKGAALAYRPEIDGLRAISVVAVILFHLKLDGFGGGYVGVDIFFVISGYLISRYVLKNLEYGQFSFLKFYAGRIRRLFPALFFTLVASFLTALILLSPEDLRDFARTVVTTIAAVSNVFFWRDAHAYFATDVHYLPLLHAWSLGVEEQFYLLWPATLFAVWRIGLVRLVPIFIFIAGLISLLACEIWLRSDASAAFYLMPFRVFEFAIGALCIWAERAVSPRLREPLTVAGLLAIGWAVVTFTTATPFPGLFAAVPCLGAALVIVGGPSTPASRLLTNRAVVGVGLISYSLYLCHWPVVVFAQFAFGEIDSLGMKLILIAMSFAISICMYFFIETPFRRSGTIAPANFLKLGSICAALAVGLISPALFGVRANGWPERLNATQHTLWQKHRYGSAPCVADKRTECAFGIREAPLGLQLIGDSKADDLVAGFDLVARGLGLRGEAFGAGGCPMLAGVTQVLPDGLINADCRARRDRFFTAAKSERAPLVISQFWNAGAGYLGDDKGRRFDAASTMAIWQMALERTISELPGRRILIVGEQVLLSCDIDRRAVKVAPMMRTVDLRCPPRLARHVRDAHDGVNTMLRAVRDKYLDRVMLLMPEQVFCHEECASSMDGVSLYWDRGHYTVAGAEYLVTNSGSTVRDFIGLDEGRP